MNLEVPRYMDDQFAQKGAARFSARGEADVSGDIEEQLQVWKQHYSKKTTTSNRTYR